MNVVIGTLAIAAIFAIIYIGMAAADNWDWRGAAQVFCMALVTTVVFIGLIYLAVFSFSGGIA